MQLQEADLLRECIMLRDGLMLYCQIALQQTKSVPLLTVCAVMVA